MLVPVGIEKYSTLLPSMPERNLVDECEMAAIKIAHMCEREIERFEGICAKKEDAATCLENCQTVMQGHLK